ncbi:inositol monophosphatase family protein [Bacterioplanoides sp.]|uniref:inositol monophosphatase family protein n=1 Tax=Bacterioplanoides sp. TaxID=2066072 RepID=UPI003B5A25A2
MDKPATSFLIQLAQQAGDLIQSQRQQLDIQFKGEGATELVTQADVAADQFITEQILQHYPNHQILSEELSPELSFDAEHLWVVDPIDGTVNYAHDHRQVAVSIAYFYQGQVESAAVYNPFDNEMFSATRGQGAQLNAKPIRCAGKNELRRAIIATGFPYQKDDLSKLTNRLHHILSHCADIRRLGSAALDICWVACGRLDGYYETVKPWDFAAAQLIATEAGASFGHIYPPADNPQLDGNNILVANSGLYPELQQLLRNADQELSA